MNRKRISIVALVLIAAWVFCAAAEACPGCAEAQAGQGAERGGIVRGYFYSILFMLSSVFVLFGSLAGYFYVLVRRNKAAADEATKAGVPTAAEVVFAQAIAAQGAAKSKVPTEAGALGRV